MASLSEDLQRIEDAMRAAVEVFHDLAGSAIQVDRKAGGDPVTEADLRIDATLRRILPRDGDGWLSEETVDAPERLSRRRVWIVDPLDGTKEFIAGVPEFCVSIGRVDRGEPIAGGIVNPRTCESIVGGSGFGVRLNGEAVSMSKRTTIDGATVLASRSEISRGEWKRFEAASFTVRPVGSVAYKLGLVAAGRADATWTLVPKHEWDVAAGVALVLAGGGVVFTPDGRSPTFNGEKPKLPGLIACGAGLEPMIRELLIP